MKLNEQVKVEEFAIWIKECIDKYSKKNIEQLGDQVYYVQDLMDNFCDWYLNEQLDDS